MRVVKEESDEEERFVYAICYSVRAIYAVGRMQFCRAIELGDKIAGVTSV